MKTQKNLYLSCDPFQGPTIIREKPSVFLNQVYIVSYKTAKSFRKCVTSEVLPSIRKTDTYEVQALTNELMLKNQELDKAMKQT